MADVNSNFQIDDFVEEMDANVPMTGPRMTGRESHGGIREDNQ